MLGKNLVEMKTKITILQTIMRVLLGAFMVLAGTGHLTFQRFEFQAQVPQWLTNDADFINFIVVASGIVELTLGLTLMFWTKQKVRIGIFLAIFYVLIFPGNISQYTNQLDGFGLNTDNQRLIRLFFQPVLILWALWSTSALGYLTKHNISKQ